MVAGFNTMGIETNSLLRRLGINLMSCKVNAMHGSSYRSCYFCDQLKELTDPSKESSLAPVRQLVIKLYRWIFRYQVWNLETRRPLLQDVFNQCAQLNLFTYFCHVTSAFDKWGKEIGCAGVDQVVSVCNIAVVTAIDTCFRLRVDWSKRTYVRLSEREMEWLIECLEEWMLEKKRSCKYFFLFPVLECSSKCTAMREWVFKETHEEMLKQKDSGEEEKLTEMVRRSLAIVWRFDLHGEEKRRELHEMVDRGLDEVWNLMFDLHGEEVWERSEMVRKRLNEIWELMKVLYGAERILEEDLKLKNDLHGVEEWERSEMVERRLEEVWELIKVLYGAERRLEEDWKLKDDLHGEEVWERSEMVKKKLTEVWELMKVLYGAERILEVDWKLKDALRGGKEWRLFEMVKMRLEEVWKLMEEWEQMSEVSLRQVWSIMKSFHCKNSWMLREKVYETLEKGVSLLLDWLRPGLWQLIWKWTLQLDLELFCDSFKRDVFLNFPKGFLDFVGDNISHCLSPRKMWMVSSRERGEIHLLRTGFQEQDSCHYTSEKQEYRFTQVKYLTFTYDDLYVVYCLMKTYYMPYLSRQVLFSLVCPGVTVVILQERGELVICSATELKREPSFRLVYLTLAIFFLSNLDKMER